MEVLARHRAKTPPRHPHFYTPHLPEKAERARVIAFSSPCAETQMLDTGNSKIPQPWPILSLPFSQLFPVASPLTSTPFKPPLPLLMLLACRNVWRAEMKLIGSQCRSVQPPVAYCCVRLDWHALARTCCKTKCCSAASLCQSGA